MMARKISQKVGPRGEKSSSESHLAIFSWFSNTRLQLSCKNNSGMKTLQECPTNRDPLFFKNGAKPQQKKQIFQTQNKQQKTRKKNTFCFPDVCNTKSQALQRAHSSSTIARAGVKQLLPYSMDGWMLAGQGTFSFHQVSVPVHTPPPPTRVEPPITNHSQVSEHRNNSPQDSLLNHTLTIPAGNSSLVPYSRVIIS